MKRLHWCESQNGTGPTQPFIEWVPGVFPELKPLERGVDQPPTSNAKIKERVELYLYFPSTFLVSKITATWHVPSRHISGNSI